jgi:CRP-like cAMP-binding protein
MKSKQERIEGLELFGGCRTAELRWIARHADEIDIAEGAQLGVAGSSVREFIVVVDGVALVDEGSVLIAGAHVGALELIGGRLHPSTIVAMTPMRALVFTPQAFNGLLTVAPSVARKLMHELVERVPAA